MTSWGSFRWHICRFQSHSTLTLALCLDEAALGSFKAVFLPRYFLYFLFSFCEEMAGAGRIRLVPSRHSLPFMRARALGKAFP